MGDRLILRCKLSQRPCSGVKVPNRFVTPPQGTATNPGLVHPPPPHPPLLRPTLRTGTQAGNWQWWEDLKDSCSSGALSCQETTPLPGTCELGVAHAGGFKGFSHLSRYQIHNLKSSLQAKISLPFPIRQSSASPRGSSEKFWSL